MLQVKKEYLISINTNFLRIYHTGFKIKLKIKSVVSGGLNETMPDDAIYTGKICREINTLICGETDDILD